MVKLLLFFTKSEDKKKRLPQTIKLKKKKYLQKEINVKIDFLNY